MAAPGALDNTNKGNYLLRDVQGKEAFVSPEQKLENEHKLESKSSHARSETVPEGPGDSKPNHAIAEMNKGRDAAGIPQSFTDSRSLVKPDGDVNKVLNDFERAGTNGVNTHEASRLIHEVSKMTPEQRRDLQGYVKDEPGIKADFDAKDPFSRPFTINGDRYVGLVPPGKDVSDVAVAKVVDISKSTDQMDRDLTADLTKANCHRYALWNSLKDLPGGKQTFEQLDLGNMTQMSPNALRTLGFREVDVANGDKPQAGDLVTASFDKMPVIGEAIGENGLFKHSGCLAADKDGGLAIKEKYGPGKQDQVYAQDFQEFSKAWTGGDSDKVRVWRFDPTPYEK